MTKSNFDHVFEEWKSGLKGKGLKSGQVAGNFDELFIALQSAGADFNIAYSYLDKAIKAHQPNAAIIKNVFKARPRNGTSEKEFAESWCADIR